VEQRGKYSAVAILSYGDDSADEKRQRVCAVAGVVGTWSSWRTLEREWLIRTNGIPFHATYCESDLGDYKGRPHAENKALYKDMAIMLANSTVYGIGVAVDLSAARRVFPANPDIAEIAYYRSFTRIIEVMKNVAKESGEIADVTFDMRLDTEHNAGLLYGSTRENQPEWTPYLAEKITFEFSHKQPRIQVADLIAYETMRGLDNRVGPKKRPIRKSWIPLHDSGRFLREEYSDDWFQRLKADYAELEKRVGFGEKDYKDWLQKKNRQHNMTNVILFFDWFDKHKENNGKQVPEFRPHDTGVIKGSPQRDKSKTKRRKGRKKAEEG
jgi:hypothetical protein